MGRILPVGPAVAALVAVTLAFSRPAAAQSGQASAPSPWTAATASATDTTAKSKSMEINSFQMGASAPLDAGKHGTTAGKTTAADIPLTGDKPLTPVYNGPVINIPPSGGTPNDSAHSHPKH